MEEKSKLNQRDSIIHYLNTVGYATVRDLVVGLNINSPTKRISELIRLGYPIKKSWTTKTNKYGETKRYIVYHWGGERL